jgi:hypothetical protein
MEQNQPNPPHRPTYVNMDWLVERGKCPETWEEDIINLGKEGKNKTNFANYLNISRDVFYKLMDRDPKLKKVVNMAMSFSEEWWQEKGRQAWEEGTSQKLNSNFFKYYMSNVYRDNWRVNVDITTDGEKVKNDDKIQIEIIRPIVEEDDNDDKQ